MFQNDKYYIYTGIGRKYDGPFDNVKDAVNHMVQLCGEFISPEIFNLAVLVTFENNILNLVKDDNGSLIDAKQIYWRRPIYYKQEVIWSPDIIKE